MYGIISQKSQQEHTTAVEAGRGRTHTEDTGVSDHCPWFEFNVYGGLTPSQALSLGYRANKTGEDSAPVELTFQGVNEQSRSYR